MKNKKVLAITSKTAHNNIMSLCPDTSDTGWEIRYNPTRGSDCDFWIVFSTSRMNDSMLCNEANTLFLAGEPPSKKVHPKRFYAQFERVFSCNPNDPHPKVQLGAPRLNWHVGLDMTSNSYRFGYKYLSELCPPEKINKISVICSNLRTTQGQRDRLDFLKNLKLELGDDIVHYGRGFEPIDDKLDAILPYAYHLVLENSRTPHYWTEKLSDAYLGYAFPFYLGAPNLDTYFDNSAYIKVDAGDVKNAAQLIRKAMQSNLHKTRLNTIKAARHETLNTYNFFNHCISLADNYYVKTPAKNVHRIDTHKAFRPFPKSWIHRMNRILKSD